MKDKGFTLIETIAVFVLLGILLTIAVPSITAIMDLSKKRNFAEDARRFIVMVKSEVEKNTEIEYPAKGLSKYFLLSDFNKKGDFKTSPYNTKYNENSYVVLSNNNGKFEYKVYLEACKGNDCHSTKIVTYEELKKYKTSVNKGNLNFPNIITAAAEERIYCGFATINEIDCIQKIK